jgi:hypothetical protein
MQLPYPNVKTPHLHPLPVRKGRGEKLGTPEKVAVVRHHPVFSNVVLFACRDFSKPGPEIARHVMIKQSLICRDPNRKRYLCSSVSKRQNPSPSSSPLS